ncbi:citryl-CoA lyase [Thalassospiraceae bacterium LMO-JJ14]|nr:citryl-CoA lyase [Thalassospiraceae bacterium LMO-JJ14]
MSDDEVDKKVRDWWQTDITEMAPGMLRYHGYAIEDLIGNVGFPGMAWLLLKGELPSAGEEKLFGYALTAGVDHGPQAPSIAIARMAATCGVGLNNAMASALNVLGDVHGGAGEQAVEIYQEILADLETNGGDAEAGVTRFLDKFFAEGGKYIPGFGHRFHKVDPRTGRLMELIEESEKDGVVSGRVRVIAQEMERQVSARKNREINMNIDGATAVVYAELGFPAPLARGFFCMSRSVGILAHAWEQMQQGGRNKGPIPRDMIWSYTGKPHRKVER